MKTWPTILLVALLWFLFVGSRRAVAEQRKITGKANDDLAKERKEVDELRDELGLAKDEVTESNATSQKWKEYAEYWKKRLATLEAELLGGN